VSLLLELFLMFAKLCAFAFGGGYVMIPSMIKASEANHWATAAELSNVIAMAGMSPGPVAVNAAVAFGYKIAGIPGAFAAFLGIVIPCLTIVIVVATFFFKVYSHKGVQAALFGLRPVITSIVLFAAISLGIKNNIILPAKLINGGINVNLAGFNLFELKSLAIGIGAFVLLHKVKVQPLYLIIGGGIIGMLAFK